MRSLLLAIGMTLLGACSEKTTTPESPSSADGGDAGDAAPGADAAASGAVDRSHLGDACANSDTCPLGPCVEFGVFDPPIEGAHCIDVPSACSIVTCPAGRYCIATGGDPIGLKCD